MNQDLPEMVAPRKRRVSRNYVKIGDDGSSVVAPRKRRVSRNENKWETGEDVMSRASQEACE